MASYNPRLNDGTPLGVGASALQKACRRGHEEVAFWWAVQMVEAGFHQYVWKRLVVIASEDVGPADPTVALIVGGLWRNWQLIHEQLGKKTMPDTNILAHGVLTICRARKSREADELKCLLPELKERHNWRPEVPHYAHDAHTAVGQRRLDEQGIVGEDRWASWYDQGVKLSNPSGQSPYHGRLAAYGGDPHSPPVSERSHDVTIHRCRRCGCSGDAICDECAQELCLGCAAGCEGLCGVYWCPDDAPGSKRCGHCPATAS